MKRDVKEPSQVERVENLQREQTTNEEAYSKSAKEHMESLRALRPQPTATHVESAEGQLLLNQKNQAEGFLDQLRGLAGQMDGTPGGGKTGVSAATSERSSGAGKGGAGSKYQLPPASTLARSIPGNGGNGDDDDAGDYSEQGVEVDPVKYQASLKVVLADFWETQEGEMDELEIGTEQEFKAHNDLPLARIKRIMKSDEDVRMISAEAPVLFAKACEMFILELSLRSWCHSEQSKRRTLQREDIQNSIKKTEVLDFLVDCFEPLPNPNDAGGLPPKSAGNTPP